ncbi:MAG: AmmeMemoRadiSam system radical SAM enzyme [Saccharofermentanales bacterium]|jgi:pyruvate formate lyase activating enzyme
MNKQVTCQLCPHYCKLSEGQIGFCGARQAKSGQIISLNYGKITALALDPIEKKPLAYFHPGSMILSVGSFGCNMACPFCQNYSIATRKREEVRIKDITPGQLIELAQAEKTRGNIGIAFTYNEPLIAFDFILDTAKSAQTEDLEIVIVSNGQINEPYLKQLLPYVSAWNIDLKSFSETGYRKLGGDLNTVLKTIELTQAVAHVEITTLVVPGISDDRDEMRAQAKYLASLNPDIPLHLSRYFPCYKYTEPATDKNIIRELKQIAEQYLNRVSLGNM